MDNVLTKNQVAGLLGRRPRDCNKGDNGKGLLLAGSEGFYGAAVMAATACLRAGIGTLKVLCPGGGRPAFYALPEAMVCSVGPCWDGADRELIARRMAEATCIGVGPGIGSEASIPAVVCQGLAQGKPMVIDADGLNGLSALADDEKRACLHGMALLTPHPGEMARLIRLPIDKIKADAEGVARRYAEQWGCTILLKGAYTVIAGPRGQIRWNTTGNSGLAKGGSGDVLTGILLALLGQGLPPFEAACAGSYILGASAEEALELLQERALLARDVICALEHTLAMLERR